MTGNLVLLGLSASTREGTLAVHAGLSLASYVGGVLVGDPDLSADVAPPGRRGVRASSYRAGPLTGGRRCPQGSGGTVSSPLVLTLLAGTAAAMGLQSAVGRAAPLVKGSTTYLTGALTEVVASAGHGPRPGAASVKRSLSSEPPLSGPAPRRLSCSSCLGSDPLLAVVAVGCVLLPVNAGERHPRGGH